MTAKVKRVALATALAAGATLAGCGGDPHQPTATEAVPASASESVSGFIAYLKELVVASADQLEPVDVSGVTPPVDETSEPDPSI
ncbi:MAG: hypothetical protein ABI520_08795 [Caldimonas sp.]